MEPTVTSIDSQHRCAKDTKKILKVFLSQASRNTDSNVPVEQTRSRVFNRRPIRNELELSRNPFSRSVALNRTGPVVLAFFWYYLRFSLKFQRGYF